MTTALLATALVLTAVCATAVVLTRNEVSQAIVLSLYGVMLVVLFVALQAPDVALSELGVGAVVVPLMVVLSITKMRKSGRRD